MTQALTGFWVEKMIGQEKELNRLRVLVYKDELTGLLNYRAFSEGMGQRLKTGEAFGLLYLDLDRFKGVNDQYGHLAGDRMLKAVAALLGKAAGPDARVYRLGGDEFALIVTPSKALDAVHERVRLGFEQADELKIGVLRVGASIGIAKFPEHGRTYEELLEFADHSMYATKHRRKTGPTQIR